MFDKSSFQWNDFFQFMVAMSFVVISGISLITTGKVAEIFQFCLSAIVGFYFGAQMVKNQLTNSVGSFGNPPQSRQ